MTPFESRLTSLRIPVTSCSITKSPDEPQTGITISADFPIRDMLSGSSCLFTKFARNLDDNFGRANPLPRIASDHKQSLSRNPLFYIGFFEPLRSRHKADNSLPDSITNTWQSLPTCARKLYLSLLVTGNEQVRNDRRGRKQMGRKWPGSSPCGSGTVPLRLRRLA